MGPSRGAFSVIVKLQTSRRFVSSSSPDYDVIQEPDLISVRGNLVAGPGQGCCCSAQNHFSHREENLLKFRPGTNFLHLSGEQFNLQINFPVISHCIVTTAHW